MGDKYKSLAIGGFVYAGVSVCLVALAGNFIVTGKDLPVARYGMIGVIGTGIVANILL